MLELESLADAIESLEYAISLAENKEFMSGLDLKAQHLIRAGVIQNFEFTYELSWKYMKRWLAENVGRSYVDGASRKELFRLGCENLLIDDFEKWMIYHNARNITSHTYNIEKAAEVYNIAKEFQEDAKRLLQNLEAKND